MSANIAAAPADRKAIMRDKRAQGIAAMGLVSREGDSFRVATPTLRGRKTSYEVWRDEAGKVRCSCLEFEEQSADEPGYRCEHILAVKHSLLAKNSEAVAKQEKPQPEEAAPQRAAAPSAEVPPVQPITKRDASEERASRKTAKAIE